MSNISFFDDIINNTFGTPNALAYTFFWVLFAYTTSLLNCDIQRAIEGNIYVKHLVGMITLFYLIAITDKQNNATLWATMLKSAGAYILFMMFLKCILIISLSILILFMIDQSIAYHIKYKQQNKDLENIETFITIRKYIFYGIILLGITGFISYGSHAYQDHKNDVGGFSIFKLFVGTNSCDLKRPITVH
jgi:hypothetical protein